MQNNLPNEWNLESLLTLTYIKGMSYAEHKKIVERYSSYAEFISNAFNVKQGEFFADIHTNSQNIENAKKQVDFCYENQISIVTIFDENYPNLLKNIASPPTILFVRGKLQNPDAISISVVGTRKCTTYGKLATEMFVSEFIDNNLIVTSGLAYGIDSHVHQTAIKKNGITYSVIASGIDKILPQTSKKLADEIVETGGAIISEYKCGTMALQGYFPQRNRIISGISRATLVIESAIKGGSLITARFAFDQGREVFAVAGNITSEKSEGCNSLIRSNAAAIAVSPQTMLQDLGLTELPFEKTQVKEITFNSKEEELIYNILSTEPIHIDSIPQLTNLDISEILVILLEMEFNGQIKQLPGKYYIKSRL